MLAIINFISVEVEVETRKGLSGMWLKDELKKVASHLLTYCLRKLSEVEL